MTKQEIVKQLRKIIKDLHYEVEDHDLESYTEIRGLKVGLLIGSQHIEKLLEEIEKR